MLSTSRRFILSSILKTPRVVIRSGQHHDSIQLHYPPSFHIEKLTKQELLQSSSLMNILCDFTAHSYLDPINRTNKAVDESTHIYLARIGDRYAGYMMIDFRFGSSVYNNQPIVHPVLGCTDSPWKKQGVHRLLHGYFLQEVQQYQEKHATKAFIWFATVTPFVTRLVPDFYSDIQPACDEQASYDPKYLSVLQQIQAKMRWNLANDERNRKANKHPFVQYGISKHIVYTDEELQRIERFKTQTKYLYNIFDQFELDVRKGDRIIYIARATDRKIEFVRDSSNSTESIHEA